MPDRPLTAQQLLVPPGTECSRCHRPVAGPIAFEVAGVARSRAGVVCPVCWETMRPAVEPTAEPEVEPEPEPDPPPEPPPPPQPADGSDPLATACPKCCAPAGTKCRNYKGQPKQTCPERAPSPRKRQRQKQGKLNLPALPPHRPTRYCPQCKWQRYEDTGWTRGGPTCDRCQQEGFAATLTGLSLDELRQRETDIRAGLADGEGEHRELWDVQAEIRLRESNSDERPVAPPIAAAPEPTAAPIEPAPKRKRSRIAPAPEGLQPLRASHDCTLEEHLRGIPDDHLAWWEAELRRRKEGCTSDYRAVVAEQTARRRRVPLGPDNRARVEVTPMSHLMVLWDEPAGVMEATVASDTFGNWDRPDVEHPEPSRAVIEEAISAALGWPVEIVGVSFR